MMTHAVHRAEQGCKELSVASVLLQCSFLASYSAGAHKTLSRHKPHLPETTVHPLCLCQQEACLFLEFLHHTTSFNHDTSWLYSQTIEVRLTRAGLLPCFGGCCSKGSASISGISAQHIILQEGSSSSTWVFISVKGRGGCCDFGCKWKGAKSNSSSFVSEVPLLLAPES